MMTLSKLTGAAIGAAALFGLISEGQAANFFQPGDLIVSRSVYSDTGNVATLTVGSNLPDSKTGATPYKAVADGTYPTVFANNTVDGSFGVTSPIFLDQFTTAGVAAGTLTIDPSVITTSFSSKSELALNLSTNGSALTFMGYGSPVGNLDVSNSNTPGVIEPGNFVTTTPTYREVAQVNADSSLQVTTTNAYAGNNGRAAILDTSNSQYLTVGNAGNGSGSTGITQGTGVQIVLPGQNATSATPGTTKVGGFNITQYGYAPDKTAKDDNYRGETIFGNTLYVTKGSGGNGIDTVYQVGNAGSLPKVGNAASAPITILPGFPTGLANTNTANFYPFGLFFANPTTLYVADEGSGVLANAATDPNAGLEKWTLTNNVWSLDYTLQNGLGLGQQYSVAGYPTALNPATDGLRNITGKVNPDGTVSIYGVTSTVSASGDQGADPNKLVAITDLPFNTIPALAAGETFTTLDAAKSGEVLRGVSFAAVVTPESSGLANMSGALLALALSGLVMAIKKKKSQKASA